MGWRAKILWARADGDCRYGAVKIVTDFGAAFQFRSLYDDHIEADGQNVACQDGQNEILPLRQTYHAACESLDSVNGFRIRTDYQNDDLVMGECGASCPLVAMVRGLNYNLDYLGPG